VPSTSGSSSSGTLRILLGLLDPGMKVLHSFETTGTTRPVTHCHIPRDLNLNCLLSQNLEYFFYGLLSVSVSQNISGE
jgi:hypothetical protein